jgi:hypothetical protein
LAIEEQAQLEAMFGAVGLHSWIERQELVQSAFEKCAAPSAFADQVVADCAAIRQDTPLGASAKQQTDELLKELVGAVNHYNSASVDSERREKLQWVRQAAARLSPAFERDRFRRMIEWLVEPTKPDERGRRATALGFVLFGAAIIPVPSGKQCTGRRQAAAAQGLTDRHLRNLMHDLLGQNLVSGLSISQLGAP